MDNIAKTLEQLGLSDKEAKLYLALLSLGPTSIRKIAEKASINRGTTYDSLKKLQQMGLVSYFHKGKLQHFAAEDPGVLVNILTRKKFEIREAENDLGEIISGLSLMSKKSNHPMIKFYENYSGIRTILEDVLYSTASSREKEYAVYSSSSIRSYLYHLNAFPNFTKKRINKKIYVRTIAVGPGGKVQGQDDRKWLIKKGGAPTYTLLYAGKVAMISVGAQDIPHGLIIEDEAIYKTQLLIFNSLWETL